VENKKKKGGTKMKKNELIGIVPLVVAVVLSGCASYSPALVRLEPTGPTMCRQVSGDLTLYVDEFATPEKSEKAFDTNLIKEGVLPLLIQVQNNSQHPYELKKMDITVQEADTNIALRSLTPEQAAGKAKKNAVTRAIGWSLIVPIVAIPVAVTASAIHTSKVNKQIVQDFSAKGFPDGTILPNKDRSGFVFFELPKGRKDLSGLNLQVTPKKEGTGEFLTITSPLPAATFKPIKEAATTGVTDPNENKLPEAR
jgi:hypothetical protein